MPTLQRSGLQNSRKKNGLELEEIRKRQRQTREAERILQKTREKEQHLKQIQKVQFLEGFSYEPFLRPGAELMSILGTAKEKEHKKLRSAVPAKVLIPDTLVVNSSGGPNVWLYTCSKGILRRTTDFVGKQVLERMGDVQFPDDAVVVKKKPRYGVAGSFGGNESAVLDTRLLYKTLSSETSVQVSTKISQQQRSNNTDELVPMVIQRFVKGKGHKAHIMRTRWEHAKRTKTWMITNTTRFDDVIKEPNENVRLINPTDTLGAVNIVSMTRLAAQENEELIEKLRNHVQAILGRRIVHLVVDTLRDDEGHLWFLQIQAYKFVPSSSMVPRQIHFSEGSYDQEMFAELNLASSKNNLKLNSLERNKLKHQESSEFGLTRVRSPNQSMKNKCKFCSCYFGGGMTQYMMTTQMILETSAHLKRRLGRDRFNVLFAGLRTGDMGMDASRVYQGHFVCSLCYNLYQKEILLAEAANEFADLLGIPLPPEIMVEGKTSPKRDESGSLMSPNSLETDPGISSSIIDSRKISFSKKEDERPRQRFRRKTTPLSLRRTTTYDQLSPFSAGCFGLTTRHVETEDNSTKPEESSTAENNGKEVFVSSMPDDTTLCRIMVAIHELHELPDFLFTSNDADEVIRPRYDAILRFEVLGRKQEVPINLYNCTFAKEGSRKLSNLQVKEMRVFPFFSERTPKFGPLPADSGAFQLITLDSELIIQLCIRPKHSGSEGDSTADLPYKMLGKCHLPLLQFKSAFLNRTDMLIPLGFSSELCEMRVSLGFDRTRVNFNGTSLDRVRLYKNAVYVPEDHFFACDPLPDDWVFVVSKEPDKPSLQQQRNSFKDILDENQHLILRSLPQMSPSNGEREVPRHSSDAICVEVSIHTARNLLTENGWPHALYAQYQFMGEWFTTKIVTDEMLGQNQSSFQFDYVHKHYVRTKDEDAMKALHEQEYLQVVLISPLNRCESVAHDILTIIAPQKLGFAQCFEKGWLVQQLKCWTDTVVEYQISGSTECFSTLEQMGLAGLKDLNQAEYLPVFELWCHLDQIWNDRKESAITGEEALYTALVVLRMHFFFSGLKNVMEDGSVPDDSFHILNERLSLILHPSHRKSVEPELIDKIDHLQKLLRNLFQGYEDASVRLSWQGIIYAIGTAFRSVEKDPINECFKSSDSLPHRVLMSEQPDDRVAYCCTIQTSSLHHGEDTVDGTFPVNDYRASTRTTLKPYHSCYLDSSINGQKASSASDYESSALPSCASSLTSAFSSLVSSSKGSTTEVRQSAFENDTKLDASPFPLKSPWDLVCSFEYLNEIDIADLVYSVEELAAKCEQDQSISPPEQLRIMQQVVEDLFDRGLESVRREDLYLAEAKFIALQERMEEVASVIEEEKRENLSSTSPECSKETSKPEFPPYLHVTLVSYPSVYITDDQERPDQDKLDVNQSKMVGSFCNRESRSRSVN